MLGMGEGTREQNKVSVRAQPCSFPAWKPLGEQGGGWGGAFFKASSFVFPHGFLPVCRVRGQIEVAEGRGQAGRAQDSAGRGEVDVACEAGAPPCSTGHQGFSKRPPSTPKPTACSNPPVCRNFFAWSFFPRVQTPADKGFVSLVLPVLLEGCGAANPCPPRPGCVLVLPQGEGRGREMKVEHPPDVLPASGFCGFFPEGPGAGPTPTQWSLKANSLEAT